MDTSTFTHFHRAGHGEILRRVAPHGKLVLIPPAVEREIEDGRNMHRGIPGLDQCDWVERAILTPDDGAVALAIQSDMGARRREEHEGESQVIAYAAARQMVAIIDEREAVAQADERGVTTRDTIWIVLEALKILDDVTQRDAAAVIDALLATGMYLPIRSGGSLIAYGYEVGYLP